MPEPPWLSRARTVYDAAVDTYVERYGAVDPGGPPEPALFRVLADDVIARGGGACRIP